MARQINERGKLTSRRAAFHEKSPSYKSMEKNEIVGGTLYLVATPIGNLADITDRAKKVLSEVDFVAAEDTRNSAKLLACLGLPVKSMISYHEHNKKVCGKTIAARLKEGQSCALITDAGTPAISDPGEDIAALCLEEGINVTSVPGACAAINALVLSGFDARRFAFEGFLEGSKNEKKNRAEELSRERRTLILYEAPHRIKETLSILRSAFGDERRIALCREMTKINEEVVRVTIGEACEKYESDEAQIRGEFVLVIEGAPEDAGNVGAFYENMSAAEHVEFYERQGLAHMDAIKAAARDRGMSKGEFYKLLI